MATASFSVTHELKRRVRLKVPGLRKDEEKAYILAILLNKNPAIERAESSPRTGTVTIHFDPERVPPAKLLTYVDTLIRGLPKKRLGGVVKNVRKPPSGKPASEALYGIEGMTCSSCALLAELMLRRVDGVEKATVSYASGTATVAGTAPTEEIFRAIEKAGYSARPADTLSRRMRIIEREEQHLRRSKNRLIASAVLSAPVVALGMSMSRAAFPRIASFVLTTPLVFGIGSGFFRRSYLLAKQGRANMDTLIALGSGAAYFYSVSSLISRRRHLYFESAAGIITLILLGRYLEEKARGKANDAIRKLLELQPATATIIRDGQELTIGIDDVVTGDELIVRPGERVPVDGEVVSGRTTVDESLVTGESMPVFKETGDPVTGGTINLGGAVRFTATAVGGDTVLAGIIRMVDHAQASKVPIQRLADRISSIFVPAVMGISGLTYMGTRLAGYPAAQALMNSVSVLLISCPCSLGLATPTAIMAGTGTAARDGIFIRDAEGLERACKLDVLVLDKTGTLTEGMPSVTDVINLSGREDEDFVRLVASAENDSEHFVGKAIGSYAASMSIDLLPATEFEYLVGRGIRANIDGTLVSAGSELFMEEQNISMDGLPGKASLFSDEGKTPIFVGLDGMAAGIISVADSPRETSRSAVRQLQSMGIEVLMVTGDNRRTAAFVADSVGIDDVVADATPEIKVEVIKSLRQKGRTVGMIGDGVNDAPALVEADVGFAIGTGTDVAIEAAQITLVNGDISKAAEAIFLSRKTMRIIRQNLFWAFAYNTLAIPMAALGKLTPTVASGAMTVSSVSVVTNSLRLQHSPRSLNSPKSPNSPGLLNSPSLRKGITVGTTG